MNVSNLCVRGLARGEETHVFLREIKQNLAIVWNDDHEQSNIDDTYPDNIKQDLPTVPTSVASQPVCKARAQHHYKELNGCKSWKVYVISMSSSCVFTCTAKPFLIIIFLEHYIFFWKGNSLSITNSANLNSYNCQFLDVMKREQVNPIRFPANRFWR